MRTGRSIEKEAVLVRAGGAGASDAPGPTREPRRWSVRDKPPAREIRYFGVAAEEGASDGAGLNSEVAPADRLRVAAMERLMKSLMNHASTLDRKRRIPTDRSSSADVADRVVPIVARRAEVERDASLAGRRAR